MNYRAQTTDSADVPVRMKDNVSVPSLPSAIPGAARVTRDSAPETVDTQCATIRQDRQGMMTSNSDRERVNENVRQIPISSDFSMTPPNEIMQSLQASEIPGGVSNWNVQDDALRTVPAYYPLEKSNRTVHDAKPSIVSGRISDCCRLMSLQATYDDKAGTASLTTEEHVEIHLSLWSGAGAPDDIIVEAQRRTGCPIKYHQYTRHILDAAQGRFDLMNFRPSSYLSIVESKEDRKEKSSNDSGVNEPLLALEIAASLIKKDRMDARRLGMESLCFLTDPSRTGPETALMASRAVLFGSFQTENDEDVEFLGDELGVREAILSLVQFGRLGETPQESDSEDDGNQLQEEKFNNLLHNLALAVLSNALEVLENQVTTSCDSKQAETTNTFLEQTNEITSRELIDSLLKVLGQAESKPHDACLSAQCLRSLLQASKKARRKARDMNAKQIVATALEVGQRTHVRLQTETENVMRELEKLDDENQGDDS